MLARIFFMPFYLILISIHKRNDPITNEVAQRLCGAACGIVAPQL